MKVWHFTPRANDKRLGKAYNDYMSLIPDGDSACLRDLDTCFLTPDAGNIVEQAAKQNPLSVLVCYTNRIHPTAKAQLAPPALFDNTNMVKHIDYAELCKSFPGNKTDEVAGPLSGFFMVVPKAIWRIVRFKEGLGLLGVDTQFFRDLRTAGIEIRRINSLYILHVYRMKQGIDDKTHLL